MKIKSMLVFICASVLTMLIVPTGVLAFNPQPEPPREILEELNDLKDLIKEYAEEYNVFTDNTAQQANALYNKINVVYGMIESGHYNQAVKKLENDISPKLTICDTHRDWARSWLNYDYETHYANREVQQLEAGCQLIIEDIQNELLLI